MRDATGTGEKRVFLFIFISLQFRHIYVFLRRQYCLTNNRFMLVDWIVRSVIFPYFLSFIFFYRTEREELVIKYTNLRLLSRLCRLYITRYDSFALLLFR